MVGIAILAFLAAAVPFLWLAGVMAAREEAAREEKAAQAEMLLFLGRLEAEPGNLDVASELRDAVRLPRSARLSSPFSAAAYAAALKCLEPNPGSTRAKIIALDVGRWHHTNCRHDKTRALFDEHAMQNDILVRCQTLPEPSAEAGV